jgi:hypothetical protein
VDDFYAQLAAVRGLRAAGYEPWVAASERGTYAERSRATAGTVVGPDPGSGTEAFVEFLAREAARLRVAAVLPCTERSLSALAGRDGDFAGIALGACPPDVLARATDKRGLAELARGAGLATPPQEVTFPAVLKPARSSVLLDGRTRDLPPARRVESRAELEAALAGGGEWVVQPFLDGTLTAVAGVAWRGELVSAVHTAARRIFPERAGASAYAETVARDAELERGVAELVGLIGWSGIYDVQFVRSGGQPFLIDFNPRVYGSMALAVAAGHNVPAIWADLLLGREPRVGEYRVGVRYRCEERDVRALLRYAAERRFGELLAGVLPRPRTTHAVFSLRDPAPLLTLVEKYRARRR